VSSINALRQDPRWILLPLRAYLGFAFTYAGISKIADRSFLDSSSATGMHATLLAVRDESPISGLLGPVEHHSFAFGLLMALGEVAVGVGLLLGLFTRIAAAGGIVLALSLFLTVSWGADPWYTGADIVYAFALTPVLLGGAGPLSADAWLASRARASKDQTADRTRRVVVGGLAGFAGLVAVGIAGLVRGDGRKHSAAAGNQPASAPSAAPSAASSSPATGPTTSNPKKPLGPVLVAATNVPVGGAIATKDPTSGEELYVLQLTKGTFTAVDRRCPHQGCPVSFVSKADGFTCPCHRSAFDATGNLTRGPATTGLKKVAVVEDGGKIVRAANG